MIKPTIYLLLALLSLSAHAQDCGKDSIHLIPKASLQNLIELSECEDSRRLLVAIPKENNKTFQVSVIDNGLIQTIDIKQDKTSLDGYLQIVDSQIYAGSFKVGNKIHLNGSFVNKSKLNYINFNHQHDFNIYEVNLDDLSLNLVVQQTVNFYQIKQDKAHVQNYNVAFFQPSSFGTNLAKKTKRNRDVSIDLTAGPSIETHFGQMNIKPTVRGAVNLRLAIPL